MAKRVGRPKTGMRPNSSVRVDPDVLYQAKVAAVIRKVTMGKWLEEAILEKADRERNELEANNSP